MIKPTIGRVVWFHPYGSTPEHQPQAALIAFVHSDDCVNLAVFNPSGNSNGQNSVYLWQNDGTSGRPEGEYAEWMPYQHGQAAKTEAVEKQLASQVREVSSIGVVKDGKLVGEYDFYSYLAAYEGKTVHWSLEVVGDGTSAK